MKPLLLFCLLFTFSQFSQALSRPMHELICDITYRTLDSNTQRFIDSIMKRSDIAPEYNTFAKACSWADEVRRTTHRETYQYHFINTPKSRSLNLKRDCARYDCVSQAIQRYALDLNDPKARADDRKEALMFVGHFVGDIHQPLHVGNGEDLGGNGIDVIVKNGDKFETTNLHSFWDHDVFYLTGKPNLQVITAVITDKNNSRYESLDISVWAKESHDLARKVVYRFPDGTEIKNGDKLPSDYLFIAEPIAQEQLIKAIVRLRLILQQAAKQSLTAEDLNG